jgi:glutathione S-transferase
MALTFYYGAGSPYAWRVWLALEYKGIPFDLRLLSFSAGDLKRPEYAAINPRRKVPAIVDDGFALYESAAILEYLDECYDEPPLLFPGDLRQRALIRRMVREADQYAANALEELVDAILATDPAEWDDAAIERSRDALARELATWETMIAGEWLAGPLSAADFTLYPIIALALRLDRKKPELDVRGRIGPQLGAWMGRIESLPYFAHTWPSHWTS